MKNNWVQAWGQSHTYLSLFHYPEGRKTYRIVINSSFGGERVRIKLSNAYGKNTVIAEKVTVALCDEEGNIKDGCDIITCTLSGKEKITIRKGEKVTLDEALLSFDAGSYICISAYVTKGDLCSGNLMNNALILTADGDTTNTRIFTNKKRPRDTVISVSQKLFRIPLHRPIPLFDTVEVCTNECAKTVVVFGDSLSQQGYWTNPFEKRLRNEFGGRYALVNRSLMGNRVLRDCSPKFILKGLYGRKATERLKEDVLPFENISHLILFIGINDIIQYGTPDAYAKEKPELEKLFEAITDMVNELHEKGIKVMMFTIPAFGKSVNGSREKDELRKQFNNMLKENEAVFDGLFDAAEHLSDPKDDYYTDMKFLGPDKMHINALGGEHIAGLLDMSFFE